MKKLLALLVLLSAFSTAIAQSDFLGTHLERNKAKADTLYNFFVNNDDLVWQKVFSTNLNYTQIYEQLSAISEFAVQSITDGRIVIKAMVDNIPYISKYKLNPMDVAALVVHTVTYSAFVDIKDNRYRVTVNQIKCTLPSDLTISITNLPLINSAYNKNKSKFRNSFIYSGLPLDTYFSDVFALIKVADHDNW